MLITWYSFGHRRCVEALRCHVCDARIENHRNAIERMIKTFIRSFRAPRAPHEFEYASDNTGASDY